MPYSKYQYVAKVAELQSISKAAAKLFISQPALTRIILNIETELGTTLFNRSVLPIQLTYVIWKRLGVFGRSTNPFGESCRRSLNLSAVS